MPTRSPTPCRTIACYATTTHKSGRCTRHRAGDLRGTPAQRGYDNKWRRFAKAYLSRHPFCVIRTNCRGNYSSEVDHIVALRQWQGSKYDDGNLQAACKACHSAKTMRENR